MDSIKNGTILVHSFGYSMTLVNFYQVIRETTATVVVREIGQEVVSNDAYMAGKVMPIKDKFLGDKEFRLYKRQHKDGVSFFVGRLDSSHPQYIRLWEGKPVAYNHCD